VYRRKAPTLWFAVMFAILGGILLAIDEWVPGAILVALAVGCSVAYYFDHDDSSGLYP
jgi:hypothetical protein